MSAPPAVLIVGGGSAGWITATTLNTYLNTGATAPVSITLVESPTTPRIGVGEATIPTIKNWLHAMGIGEMEFMRATDATFKQAIRFDDWAGPGRRYLHPFHRFAPHLTPDVFARWLASDGTVAFSDLVSAQGALIAHARGPRTLQDGDYGGTIPYAYHLDAEKFGDFLAERSASQGVNRIRGHVADIARDDDGCVKALTLEDGRRLEADLFVDCTGFSCILSNKADKLPSDWQDQSSHLLCDRAVVFRVPRESRGAPPTFTRARALSAGWCWDIALSERRGRGYVYSGAHIDDDAAEMELRDDAGAAAEASEARIVRFRVGRKARPWSGNVVSIGLSAGFLEPLESTGLYLAEFASGLLKSLFPPTVEAVRSPVLAKRFNEVMGEVHDSILDFIQLHYAVAQRRDSDFWRDASDIGRLSDRLAAHLEMWELRPPSYVDFSLQFPPFSHVNYEFILLGSGWRPKASEPSFTRAKPDDVIARSVASLLRSLPTTDQLSRMA